MRFSPMPNCRTLDDLREWAGTDGAKAVEMAQWDAVAKFARNAGDRIPGYKAASTLASEAARVIMGWKPGIRARSRRDRLDLGRQAVAALNDWRLAGCPLLVVHVDRVQHFIQSYRDRAALRLEASHLSLAANPKGS